MSLPVVSTVDISSDIAVTFDTLAECIGLARKGSAPHAIAAQKFLMENPGVTFTVKRTVIPEMHIQHADKSTTHIADLKPASQ